MPRQYSCYYEVLGVDRTVDEAAVKKAYRQLALRWHPDKNPHNKDEAERKFKEIAEAYEVLSDKNKRLTYDRYGKEGLRNDGWAFAEERTREQEAFRSPFDVFREFFGAGDPFRDFFADHRDFFTFPDPFDPFFSSPLLRNRGERLGRFDNDFDGFFKSKVRSDPISNLQESNCGFSSTIKFTSGEPGQAAAVRKTSTSTKIVDGKTITTKKVEESGTETIEVLENGKLKSKIVNGVQQPPAPKKLSA